MTSIKMKYDCGCGFTTDKLEAAEQHSMTKKHTVAVTGEIRTEKERIVKKQTIKED